MSKDKQEEVLVIPEGVKSIPAYKEYITFRESIYARKDRIWITKVNKTEINLLATTHIVNRVIDKDKKVSPEEKVLILKQHKVFRKLIGELAIFHRKAFALVEKNDENYTPGILDSKKAEIIEYFGRYYSLGEVHKIVTQDWGYNISYESLSRFRSKYINQIEERQTEYKQSYADIRLGYKRSRLDELSYLYVDMKNKYQVTKAAESYRLLLQTIEQIRKEVEGDILMINGKIEIDIEETINVHIQQEILNSLNLKTLILARVAARLNVNPMYLMSRLMNSYYAKFSGYQKPDRDIYEDEIIYPSSFVYDFDEIAIRNKLLEEREGILKNIPILPQQEEDKNLSIKDLILQTINKKRTELDDSLSRIEDQKEKREGLEK